MKTITKDVIDRINAIYKKYGQHEIIDPNYNLNDPFMFKRDSADPYLFKSCSWEKMYNAVKKEIENIFDVHSLEEFKKISPFDVIEELDNADSDLPERFTDYQDTNDLGVDLEDMIFDEFDDPYANLYRWNTDPKTDIKIHNEVAKLLGLEEYLLNEDDLTEDSKMKKDVDPKLELVDKIKNYSNEYEVLEYNLDDDYFIYDEIDYSFYTKNKKSFENWLKGLIVDVLDPREKKELNKLIEDFNKENNIYPLNKIIDKFLYHFGFPGVPVLYANTVEGLKEAYEFVQERFDSDTSVNDSKQKQICDSFNKRYKGDK